MELLLLSLQDLVVILGEMALSKLDRVLFSVLAIVIGLSLQRVLAEEAGSLREQKRVDTPLLHGQVRTWER